MQATEQYARKGSVKFSPVALYIKRFYKLETGDEKTRDCCLIIQRVLLLGS